MAGRLGGKVAVVTGAGSGIGRAAATLFAREGAAVAAVDLAGQAAAETTAAIAAEGGRALAVTADISDSGQVDAAFGRVAAELGPPDVLYNNAGVNSSGSVIDASDDDWDRSFAVNAKGTFYYFHGGKYVTGTWSKGAVNDVFQFTVSDGTPLKMASGQTYIELPQINAKIKIKIKA